jgi:cytochrome P450
MSQTTPAEELEPSGDFEPAEFLDPANASNPQPFYARLRSIGPVVPSLFGVQLTHRESVELALQNPEVFSSAMEAVDLGQKRPLIPLQVDPPDHLKYRRLLDPIFAPRLMNPLEPYITELVNELIDGFIERGECNFSAELAVPLPSAVFLRLLGLPLSDLDTFLTMKDGILRPQGATLEEMKESQSQWADKVDAYFQAALAQRMEKREDDVLSRFLDAEVQGERLTEDEILGICFLFLLAGLDTVTDSLECFFAYLAQHPDRRQQIVDDPSIIPAAVEELLRWETPVTGVSRVTAQETTIGDRTLPAGTQVGVCLGAANTDPAQLADADVVDLTRNPNRHLAFGGGLHRCLGSHLARLELRVVLREWHRRIPSYRLPEGTTLTYQPGLRQIDNMPLVFGS